MFKLETRQERKEQNAEAAAELGQLFRGSRDKYQLQKSVSPLGTLRNTGKGSEYCVVI